ncbi:MAG: SDR family oxidoreductase [Candidatus Gracilibacteria bacterium]|nr:SDR family oxidoreductase [Candidatus Gracilibacteria bacterium]
MSKILITGTTSGIGNYLGNLLKEKYQIIGLSKSENNIEGIDFLKINLENIEEINELKIENIDYLILNAGIGFFDKFENISLENHIKTINTNLIGNISLIHKLFNKINIGIIFIGSLSSKKSQKLGTSYCASKFGLRGFAMSLKNENNGKKIFFINPKIVKSNLHKNSKIEIFGKFSETPIQEIGNCIENILEKKETRFEIDL